MIPVDMREGGTSLPRVHYIGDCVKKNLVNSSLNLEAAVHKLFPLPLWSDAIDAKEDTILSFAVQVSKFI